MKPILRTTLLLLPLVLAACPQDEPTPDDAGADLSMSEAPDLSVQIDLASSSDASDLRAPTDQTATDALPAEQTFTWEQVNGWWALAGGGGTVCQSPQGIGAIVQKFCTARGYRTYYIGCTASTLQSVICQDNRP